MENLRQTILAEEDKIASKSRFGLFSQPPPLSIGDDSPYKKYPCERGEDGKPKTNPPQLLSGTCRTGNIKSSYFSVPESIYSGDKFVEQHKTEAQYQKKMHSKAGFHEHQFRPASGYKTLNKPSYNHIGEKEQRAKARRDADGRVKTEPPNFITNPMSKVEKEFLKYPNHMADPYQRKGDEERKYQQNQRKKILYPESSFKYGSHGNKTFQKDSSVYGLDERSKSLIVENRKRIKTTGGVAHESDFKPAIKASGNPFGAYPAHMDPTTAPQKRRTVKDDKKEIWKSNNFGKSRPTPSIKLHPKNLHILRSFK